MANNTEGKRRTPTYDIHSLILNRWSPRSMTGEELTNEVLMSLFEAARWAPSSYNNQPWRFIYAKSNTEYWERFFNLLVDYLSGEDCQGHIQAYCHGYMAGYQDYVNRNSHHLVDQQNVAENNGNIRTLQLHLYFSLNLD